MTIGSGIALFVVRAIMTFAINIEIEAIDLHLIGYILMGAGVVVVLLGIIFSATRRNRDIDVIE